MNEEARGAEGEHRRPRGQLPGSAGHGRWDYSGLETIEEIHDLAEDERVCPNCGAPYVAFGEETSEQIDWQVRIVRDGPSRPNILLAWQIFAATLAATLAANAGR